jgi:hypothetical protein
MNVIILQTTGSLHSHILSLVLVTWKPSNVYMNKLQQDLSTRDLTYFVTFLNKHSVSEKSDIDTDQWQELIVRKRHADRSRTCIYKMPSYNYNDLAISSNYSWKIQVVCACLNSRLCQFLRKSLVMGWMTSAPAPIVHSRRRESHRKQMHVKRVPLQWVHWSNCALCPLLAVSCGDTGLGLFTLTVSSPRMDCSCPSSIRV